MRVKVKAVGLNPVDYKLADGAYFWAHDTHVLGLDVAGVVDELGEGVDSIDAGKQPRALSELRILLFLPFRSPRI